MMLPQKIATYVGNSLGFGQSPLSIKSLDLTECGSDSYFCILILYTFFLYFVIFFIIFSM